MRSESSVNVVPSNREELLRSADSCTVGVSSVWCECARTAQMIQWSNSSV